ncbi:MAG: response regulator [Betaproteobacteria bacterium]
MPRVLIVDDDAVTADQFARVLLQEGFDVATAYNGRDGLRKASEARPDLVVMDLRMPLMDGLTLIDTFRSGTALHDVPAVVVTGDYLLDESDLARLNSVGVSIRFKPLWLDDLVEMVHTLVKAGANSFEQVAPTA